MAEVQTNTESGEMTQRFIEFVMMQAQNAAFALGQIRHPQTGAAEVNLDMAKLFIDHLVMIRSKTRGNLSNEEAGILNNAISTLQMAFVEVSQGKGAAPASEPEEPEPSTPSAEQPASEAKVEPQTGAVEGESKKKFTKSYGA